MEWDENLYYNLLGQHWIWVYLKNLSWNQPESYRKNIYAKWQTIPQSELDSPNYKFIRGWRKVCRAGAAGNNVRDAFQPLFIR
jgi:hypothetical protein